MSWILFWQIVAFIVLVGIFALAITQERNKKP